MTFESFSPTIPNHSYDLTESEQKSNPNSARQHYEGDDNLSSRSPLTPPFKTVAPSSQSSHSKNHFDFPTIFKLKWLKPALIFQNSGSVARDHLSSERTFLGYVRTSLALASTGVGLVQLFTIAELTSKSARSPLPEAQRRLKAFAMPLGTMTLLFSLIVLFMGVYRYFVIQHALPQNEFPASTISILFISFILGALVVVVFGAILNEEIKKA